ncbi:hypothetical protein NON00_21145 [Roseomonas sp. GC11]|uniref:hypothetical protein n=1 Tax=Roseomonas sp. GC11 TaxID=2950546 RepID=UPI00210B9A0E|nr:hypothetical protein [Roseomonas sp. GC11]MCQ4162423.1 hypothetical protein [Roseomonas sp. GC11]
MTAFSAPRAFTLALTLAAALALPGLAQARDLEENANHGATSDLSASTLVVTRLHEAEELPGAAGDNAQASEAWMHPAASILARGGLLAQPAVPAAAGQGMAGAAAGA